MVAEARKEADHADRNLSTENGTLGGRETDRDKTENDADDSPGKGI